MNKMNKEILSSIIKANYVFLGDIRNSGSQNTYLEMRERLPFYSCGGSRYTGIHATTIIQECGMWSAKWALRSLKNLEIKPIAQELIIRYWDANFYLTGTKKTLVQQTLEKELIEVLGTPPVGQEMCVYEMYDSLYPERDTGWFLYSKDRGDLKETKVEAPLI